MQLRDAIKDTNKALKALNEQDYTEGFKCSFRFIKQGFRDIFYGVKQLIVTLACLSIYPLLPIFYPIAVLIRVFKK